jgi:hypothetical protein
LTLFIVFLRLSIDDLALNFRALRRR